MKKAFAMMIIATSISACSSAPYTPGPDMDQIYKNVNDQGEKDAIYLLRRGLKSRSGQGVTDPYKPLRNPEFITPVWVTKKTNPITGRFIDPHWEYIVTQETDWAK